MHPPHVTNVIVHENGTMIAPTSSTTTNGSTRASWSRWRAGASSRRRDPRAPPLETSRTSTYRDAHTTQKIHRIDRARRRLAIALAVALTRPRGIESPNHNRALTLTAHTRVWSQMDHTRTVGGPRAGTHGGTTGVRVATRARRGATTIVERVAVRTVDAVARSRTRCASWYSFIHSRRASALGFLIFEKSASSIHRSVRGASNERTNGRTDGRKRWGTRERRRRSR